MSKRLGTSVAWALLATVWMGPAIALEAPVVGDSYVKPKGSTAVFGTRAAMVVNQSNDTYVQFDTSGVSEPFERAEMRIQLKVLRRAGDLSLHRLLGPWTETTLNSKNVPDSDPTGTTAQLADEADVFVADITDLVQSWIDDPSSNHGLVIQSSGGRAVFWSRNSAKPPTLSLTDSGGDVPEEPEETAPTARDDRLSFKEQPTWVGDVLQDNGSGADESGSSEIASVEVLTQPHTGSLEWAGDGTFVFTPPPDFIGSVEFEYRLHSSNGLSSASATATLVRTPPPSGQPNILYFVADDLGWGDLPAYNSDAAIPMPTLDALAAEGMRFTDAHTAASLCAPSRYSLITGNYHWRGLEPYGQWYYRGGSQIILGQQTLAAMLQDAGYTTAAIGKHHLGSEFYHKTQERYAQHSERETVVDFSRQFREGPTERGFDYAFSLLAGLQASPYAYFENDRMIGNPNTMVHWSAGRYGRSIVKYPGIGVADWDSTEAGPRLVGKAIEFIDTHHKADEQAGTRTPFFMYYASQAKHSPFTPPAKLLGTPIRNTTGLGKFADMIYEIDVALGKLIEALLDRGLLENTLIVFTSDNGGIDLISHKGHDSLPGLRGEKGDTYEGGHRVPLIFKLGDGTVDGSVIAPGTVSPALIAAHDAVATILQIVGVTPGRDQAVDSYSFAPLLLGEVPPDQWLRDELIMEGRYHDKAQVPHHFAYRKDYWKVIFDERRVPQELYDLASDLGERNNLINRPEHAALVAEMTARLNELHAAPRTAP